MTDPSQFRVWLDLLPPDIRGRLVLIPLQHNSKVPDLPEGESWKDPKYHLTPEQALERLESGKNVGVVGTKNTVVILDIERENVPEASKYIPQPLVDTLIVRTRSGGLHLYYLNSSVPNRDLVIGGRRIVEVRSDWRYVVAPGSFVPANGTGDGLYKVVNRRRPLELSPDLLPWMAEIPEKPVEAIKFDGEYLSLPCIQELFRVPLTSGRKVHGAKLVAIAAAKDGKSEEEVTKLSKYYAKIQSRPGWPVPENLVLSWFRSTKRYGYEWSCGEMVNMWRGDNRIPPCNYCPVRLQKWRSSTS